MAKQQANHPQWALKHRKEGTELRLINDKYYLYAYKTVYDKANKKPKKVTGKVLGSITEKDGFKPSPKRELEARGIDSIPSVIRCKEYGVVSLVTSAFAEYGKKPAKSFWG